MVAFETFSIKYVFKTHDDIFKNITSINIFIWPLAILLNSTQTILKCVKMCMVSNISLSIVVP